jgi:hypothetical protein
MIGIYLVVALVVLALLFAINMMLKSSLFRVIIITYTFLIASLVYFSFETYKGWPTADKTESGQVLWVMVVDPRGANPGIIYFWVLGKAEEHTWIQKLYTYEPNQPSVPRSHWIPYSKGAAAKFREAQDAIQQGMVVTIEEQNSDEANSSKGKGEGKGKAKGTSDIGDSKAEDYDVPHLNILSPDELLQKG